MPEAAEVQSMFGRIARRYDLLNRVLSMGVDQGWRRRLLARAGDVRGRRIVDVCCGTGDLSMAFGRAQGRVLGIDFTHEMLEHAVPKVEKARGVESSGLVFAQGDAMCLPVCDASVDICCVAFGIRNVADRRVGLREMRRVLRPGGQALVLEFAPPPPGLFGAAYRFYFTRILPLIGGWISGDAEAYRYLPRTVLEWPDPDEFQREMEGEGLMDCGHELLAGGIACLHWGHSGGKDH